MAITVGPHSTVAEAAGRWLVRLLLVAAVAIIFVPLVLTAYLSVFDETLILFPPHAYTTRWYSRILPEFGGALSTLLLAPLTVPGIAIGLGIYVVAVLIEERTEWPLSGSIPIMVAAHVLIALPWVVRLCMAALANADPAAAEAAASLGAPPWRVLWRITLPAMRGGIVAGALFAFIVSFENLEMTLFLTAPGMTTLPIAVLQYLQYHIDPLVAAVAVAQVLVIGTALVLLDRWVPVARAMA